MEKVGRINYLKIVEQDDQYITFFDGKNDIRLKKNKHMLVQENKVRVFIYPGNHGKRHYSLKMPYAQVGEFGNLKILDVTHSGAFASWGIEKDLYIPNKYQDVPLEKDTRALIFVAVDKLTRSVMGISAIDDYVMPADEFIREKDAVSFLIHAWDENFFKVIVNNRYRGLLPRGEVFGDTRIDIGKNGFVVRKRDDGLLEISLHNSYNDTLEAASAFILQRLKAKNGFLPFNDKTYPRVIEKELQMSKKLFKKCTGVLLKKRRIKFTDKGIQLLEEVGASSRE